MMFHDIRIYNYIFLYHRASIGVTLRIMMAELIWDQFQIGGKFLITDLY